MKRSIFLEKRYDNIDFIGSGGMGVVFRAHDRELDKVVALKVLHPNFAKNEQMIERFRKEKSRGKLFFRLMQQAAGTSPKTYDTLIGGSKPAQRAAQHVGVS